MSDSSESMNHSVNQYVVYERSSIAMPSTACAPNWRPRHVFGGHPMPSLWTPMDAYYRPQHMYCPNEHSIHCCFATDNTTGCRQSERNLCPNCTQMCSQSNDSLSDSKANQSGDTFDNNCPTSDAVIDSVAKSEDQALDQVLEETTIELRKTRIDLIESNKRLAVNAIEKYKQDLNSLTDCVERECNRFSTNDSICAKLMAFKDQLNEAIVKTKEVENEIESQVSAQKLEMSEDVNSKCDSLPFEPKSLPELPNLLVFYKELIDSIPIEVFERPAVDANEDKDLIGSESDNSLVSNEVNVDSNLKLILNTTKEMDTNPNAVMTKVSNINEKIGNDLFAPIALPMSLKDQMSNIVEKKIPKFVSPLEFYSSMDSNINVESIENSVKVESIGNTTTVTIGKKQMDDSLRTESTDPKVEAISQFNQSQQRLLDRLKDRFPHLSEDMLIDSIAKTKQQFISVGHSKGFSGLKISEIITKICEYIDKTEMVSKSVASQLPNDVQTVGQMVGHKCGVCSKQLGSGEKTQGLSCRHIFHIECIKQWADTHTSCPNCPQKFTPFYS